MLFSIDWKLLKRCKDVIEVEITFLDENGKCEKMTKLYREWIGVCTNNIDGVVSAIKQYFPDNNVTYQQIGEAKKVLPYFEDRLAKNKFDYRSKPFYKVYTTVPHSSIGECVFKRYKIGFYSRDDWLTRIYIDLCTQYDTRSFYYKWYRLRNDSKILIDSLEMVPDRRDQPDWTVAAFDIESVPLKGNHVPIGHHESDRIVMLSVYKWNRRDGVRKWLLYLLPETVDRPLPGYEHGFRTESEMLTKFHALLDDAQVLTGYNINAFDFPCIFARLVWLNSYRLLARYKSFKVGSDLVVRYDGKIVLDLYTYFKTFSGYDLPSFKLDDVARIKLKGEKKLPVKSTGIWSWYKNSSVDFDLLMDPDVQKCFDALKPETVSKSEEFGTFRTYLDYCLKDSELVHLLFEKEYVLSFLVERANFTSLNAVEVLHLGNSRYLLELFKTYGTRLGYFVNPNFFSSKLARESKYECFFKGKTYQGALNYCKPKQHYEDVSVMDFSSMYPSTLLSSNLCYGTCTIMTREEWLNGPKVLKQMTAIPYREHSDLDFIEKTNVSTKFSYPVFDPNVDTHVIVINENAEAFLPQIVKHFIQMRQNHQREWKQTKDIYHYNIQLGIKILINSLYGVMANKDSPLAYLPIAMTIVNLSRYQLLGSYHYLTGLGYDVCYADTDSLMVHKWPVENCDRVNQFLSLTFVELKYEQRMKRLLVLSKKRYIYEKYDGSGLITKGFQKKINGLVEFMTDKILKEAWHAIFENPALRTPSNGWILWVDTISEANYRCRDPKKYSVYRKIKNLNEYKSTSCPSVKFLKKYPDKIQEHVEFTYSRADVAAKEASNWIMQVEDCQYVNYEQLFMSQKKTFYLLINIAYWGENDLPVLSADMVLNAMHWKKMVLAEMLHFQATNRRLVLLVEPGIKYTFTINDHLGKERKRGRKRQIEL